MLDSITIVSHQRGLYLMASGLLLASGMLLYGLWRVIRRERSAHRKWREWYANWQQKDTERLRAVSEYVAQERMLTEFINDGVIVPELATLIRTQPGIGSIRQTVTPTQPGTARITQSDEIRTTQILQLVETTFVPAMENFRKSIKDASTAVEELGTILAEAPPQDEEHEIPTRRYNL